MHHVSVPSAIAAVTRSICSPSAAATTLGSGGDARASASVLAANRDTAVFAFRIMFAITIACLSLALLAFWRMEEKPLQTSNEGRG